MQKSKNKINNNWVTGYIIVNDNITEVKHNPQEMTITITEYGHRGIVFKTEAEAMAYIALKEASGAKKIALEKEEKKWWQIWK